MNRDHAIALLRDIKSEYAQAYGIEALGLFGSTARGEARPDSDLDVCVQTRNPDPFPLVHLKAAIEARAGCRVDLVRVRDRMNPHLKTRIQRDAVYV